jgi:hypothetical protein
MNFSAKRHCNSGISWRVTSTLLIPCAWSLR